MIAAEINDRREEGDLRENGGYHAAARSRARKRPNPPAAGAAEQRQVGEAPKQSGVALPGSVVTVYYDDDKVTGDLLIATRREGVSDGKLEVYSPKSPLGEA